LINIICVCAFVIFHPIIFFSGKYLFLIFFMYYFSLYSSCMAIYYVVLDLDHRN